MILELEKAIANRIRQAVASMTQVVEFPDEPNDLGRPCDRSLYSGIRELRKKGGDATEVLSVGVQYFVNSESMAKLY
jgi:hypothetical protein